MPMRGPPYTPRMTQPMTVLVAPDSFGDTLTAVAAADCIAAGWLSARSDDTVLLAPQSDGGPGFVDVLASRLGIVHTTSVRRSGPRSTPGGCWTPAPMARRPAWSAPSAAGCTNSAAHRPHVTALAADSSGLGQLIVGRARCGCEPAGPWARRQFHQRRRCRAIGALGGPDARTRAVVRGRDRGGFRRENPLLGPLGGHRCSTAEGRRPRDRRRDRGADAAMGTVSPRWPAAMRPTCPGRRRRGLGCGAAGAGRPSGCPGRRSSPKPPDRPSGRRRRPRDHGEDKFDARRRCGESGLRAHLGGHRLRSAGHRIRRPGRAAPDEIADAGISGAYAIVDRAGSVELAMSDAARQLTGLAADVAARWIG